MPLPGGVSGLYHLTLVGEHLGNRTQNGFWFRDKEGTPNDSYLDSLVSLINDFHEWAIDPMKAFASSSWHLNGLVGVCLNPSPGPIIELGPLLESGGQDAESLPADCAGVVALKSGFTGRSNCGRVYVPAISKSSCDGDYLTGDSLAQLQAFGDALVSRFGNFGTSTQHVMGIYSRKLGVVRNPGPPVTLTYNPVGFLQLQSTHARRLICSMRRRRPDHGI